MAATATALTSNGFGLMNDGHRPMGDARTLKDRLSHLTLEQVSRLLGGDAAKLMRAGGSYELNPAEHVRWDAERLHVSVNGAVVTIATDAAARKKLAVTCTACPQACIHAAAAFSLVLEEKTALGLAAPPDEDTPSELLSERQLVERALEDRRERARTERMSLRSLNTEALWSDYLVTSAESGKTYRVALRGWEAGESFCTCPDYRTNTLGICKHILFVQQRARSRFSARDRARPYVPHELAVFVRYGRASELRLLAPPDLDRTLLRTLKPLMDAPITDVHDLLERVRIAEASGYPIAIYPDAEEYIQQWLHQDRLQKLVADIRRDPANHPLRTTLLRTELLPYQLDGIALAAGAGRAILADDMGLGKTIQAIGVAELLAREAGAARVLIICPTTLKSQWRSEIERFGERSCRLILGGAAERAAQYDNDCFFTVCNYEQVLRDIMSIERNRWDLIVLDEGQRIKNWEAQTSRVVKGLRSRFALVLSGTPLENRVDDLFSVAQFVDERRLGPAFRFFHRHRVVNEKGKVLGIRELADLRERLKPILLRRTRAQVLDQLPKRTTQIIRINPTGEQYEIHNTHLRIVSSIVRKPFITEMDLLRLRKALLMCRMAADSTFLVDKQPPGYSTKLETLTELLEQLLVNGKRKAVLFSEWTTMLDLIEPVLRRLKINFVRLDGSVPQKKRAAIVQDFHRDECRLFITTNAGSTGLNLQVADTVINVDLPWNPAVLEQRIGRAHRMGQKRPVEVYILVTVETIEENMLGTLSAKNDLALAVLDVQSQVDRVDIISNTEELKRRLEVLLGTKPVAPPDQSQANLTIQQAEELGKVREAALAARRARLAEAGGQLLTAALAFAGEMMPERVAAPAAAGDGVARRSAASGGERSNGRPKGANGNVSQREGSNGGGPATGSDPDRIRQQTELIKRQLAECLTRDDAGRPQWTITLPNAGALDTLAASLARMMGVLG